MSRSVSAARGIISKLVILLLVSKDELKGSFNPTPGRHPSALSIHLKQGVGYFDLGPEDLDKSGFPAFLFFLCRVQVLQ